jgi:hypothetical protein
MRNNLKLLEDVKKFGGTEWKAEFKNGVMY